LATDRISDILNIPRGTKNHDVLAAAPTRTRLIVVLGMHRSGTSAVTRGLIPLGVELGGSLLPPDKGINDAGYWEDIELIRLNTEMLHALRRDWHYLAPPPQNFVAQLSDMGFLLRAVDLLREKIGTSAIFGFKDPRLALLLPFWKEVFAVSAVEVSYILTIRHPISVVKSLEKRDQFDLEKSAMLWLTHTVSSLDGMLGEPSRALIDYDRLMCAPEHELYRVAANLNLRVDPNELKIYSEQFLDHKLRHTAYAHSDLAFSSFTASFVRDLYSVLLEAASGRLPIDAPALAKEVAKSRRELNRWSSWLKHVDSLYDFKRCASREIATREMQIREAEAQVAQIHSEMALERTAAAKRDAAISGLEAIVAERSSQINQLSARLEGTEGELLRERQTATRDSSTMTGVEGALEHSRQRVNETQARLEGTEVELRNERQASAYRDGRINALENAHAERVALIESMNREWAQRRLQMENLLQTVGAYGQKIDALTSEGELAKRKDAALQSAIGANEQRIVTLTAEREAAQFIAATLQKAVGAYEQEITALAGDGLSSRRRIVGLQETIGDYEQAIDVLTSEGDTAQCTIAALQGSLGAYEAKIDELTARGDTAQRTSAALQGTADAYQERIGALAAEREIAEREIETLQRNIAVQSEKGHSSEMARAHLLDRLAESNSEVDDLEATVRTLQEQVRGALKSTRRERTTDKTAAGRKSELCSFLDFDGLAFVRAAYLALLRREPDLDGQMYYWRRLRVGVPKLQILGELSFSEEGLEADCRIAGLKKALQMQRLARIPIVGNLMASMLKVESVGTDQTRLRALEQQLGDAVLSLELHSDHVEQSFQLLREITSRRNRLDPTHSFESSFPPRSATAANELGPRERREPFASRRPIVFQLEYAATASPASVGLSDDTRELAAGFQRIRVTDESSGMEIVDINFQAGGNARDVVLFGFSDNEEWGTWTSGKKSAFVVWRPAEENLGTLQISIEANVFEGAFSELQCVLTSSVGHRTEFLLRDCICEFQMPVVAEGVADTEMFFGGTFGTLCPNNVSLSGQTPKFSIIILNFNKPQLSLLSASSVLASSISHPYEVIIVDNGSTDENFAVLEASNLPFRVHRIPCNRYFGEGNNIGAEAARGEYLVFLNNDAFLGPGCIDAMLRAFDADARCGIAGPIFRYPDGRLQEVGAFIGADGIAEQRGKFGSPFNIASLPQFDVVDYVSAACLMIRTSRFFDVGGFNYRFDPAYFEDTDLCFRMRLRNEHVLLARDAVCFHIENATTADKRSPTGAVASVDHNRKVFLSIWGKYLIDRSPASLPRGLLPSTGARPQRAPKPDGACEEFTQATYSPYPLLPGGGERYILGMTRALNQFGPAALVTPDPFSSIRLDNVMFDLGLAIGGLGTIPLSAVATQRLERAIVMGNEIYPPILLPSRRSFFHCQFPFPLSTEGAARLETGMAILGEYEKVIVNSEFTKRAYERELGKLGRNAIVEVLHPPVATDRFLSLERNQKPWIISVGRFSAAGHSKRQDVLIQALKATSRGFRKGWKLILCGNVPNNPVDRAYFKQLNDSVGDDIDVEFILAPATRQLDSLLAQASIYAHACGFGVRNPDEYWKCEHFGITLVEALAAGCQVICYEVGGGPEIIASVGSGATFGSIEQLAVRLEDMADQAADPAVRRRTSEIFGDEAFFSRMTALVR
jgi:GT2 family glycosyltransferase/glycosyltransferase involved in cell wall biosynthesis